MLQLANSNLRVFEVNVTDTTAFLASYFGNDTAFISAIEAAYPLGEDGLNTAYDQISQIFTEMYFQCAQAELANATASIGTPAWRYYFNASFENTQLYPDLGVYHSSEIPIVFGTHPVKNATTQENALSNSMMSAWARFAKNPAGGPGWNQVGTGSAGAVLSGASDVELDGVLMTSNSSVVSGAWDLGLWGNRLGVMGGGITLIDQYEVDYRCGLYRAVYEAAAGMSEPST